MPVLPTCLRPLAAFALAAALALPAAAHAQGGDATLAAAGDIACSPNSASYNGGLGDPTECRQRYTSDLLVSGGYNAVLALGDNQYENGEYQNFLASYDPTWGRVKSITHPATGNHEYQNGSGSPLGKGYFDYYNGPGNNSGPAGDRDKGYYSFDLGSWHLISLNSGCEEIGGCGAGTPQEQWLREDLFAHRTSCTLAYWHHPLYSSGDLGNHSDMRPLWQALYEAGAELVLSGHDHNYERFAPQNATSGADPSYGIREFVVGTGGKSLRDMGTLKPNSEARQNTAFGVLGMTLHPSAYDFRFLAAAGSSYSDSGTGVCHGGPPSAYPQVVTTRASAVTDRRVTLAGTVNPRGQPTAYHFDYGKTRRYGRSTPTIRVTGNDPTPHTVTATLRMKPRKRVYYHLVAENAAGTTIGRRRTASTFAKRGAYARVVARTQGLAGYWRLGDRRGRKAVDETRNFVGSYHGHFGLKRPGAISVDKNTAVSFDRGELAAKSFPLAITGSIEGWFLWQGGSALMRDGTKGGRNGWILAYDDGGRVSFRAAGKSFKTKVSTISVQGRWHHFALVKNGARAALYIDGKRVGHVKGVRNRRQRGLWHVMRNGIHRGGARGRADEIAVYTTALSGRAIQRHFRLRRRR